MITGHTLLTFGGCVRVQADYFNFAYLNGWTITDRKTENCFNDNKMQVSSEMIWEQ